MERVWVGRQTGLWRERKEKPTSIAFFPVQLLDLSDWPRYLQRRGQGLCLLTCNFAWNRTFNPFFSLWCKTHKLVIVLWKCWKYPNLVFGFKKIVNDLVFEFSQGGGKKSKWEELGRFGLRICSALVVTPDEFHSCNKYLLFLSSTSWVPQCSVPYGLDHLKVC